MGEMRIHKDNGKQVLDANGQPKLTGIQTDTKLNSHIFGTPVLMLTIGDTMDYHLIRPDYSRGQDYTCTSGEARENFKKRRAKCVKTVPLADGTLYVHTAHDDELYHHTLDFCKEILATHKNHIRVVLVYRWLSVSAYFRADENDCRGNRYSMVDRYAFERLWEFDKSPEWCKALGFIDDRGNNIIKALLK